MAMKVTVLVSNYAPQDMVYVVEEPCPEHGELSRVLHELSPNKTVICPDDETANRLAGALREHGFDVERRRSNLGVA